MRVSSSVANGSARTRGAKNGTQGMETIGLRSFQLFIGWSHTGVRSRT
jgi:hypothetical protein